MDAPSRPPSIIDRQGIDAVILDKCQILSVVKRGRIQEPQCVLIPDTDPDQWIFFRYRGQEATTRIDRQLGVVVGDVGMLRPCSSQGAYSRAAFWRDVGHSATETIGIV